MQCGAVQAESIWVNLGLGRCSVGRFRIRGAGASLAATFMREGKLRMTVTKSSRSSFAPFSSRRIRKMRKTLRMRSIMGGTGSMPARMSAANCRAGEGGLRPVWEGDVLPAEEKVVGCLVWERGAVHLVKQ